jgi:hypothetical protein
VTIKAIGGTDFGHNVQLTNLLLHLQKLDPPSRPQPPTWDLSFVLKVLESHPFEPLNEVPLKMLTFKVVFLIAFATAKRRGELHALLAAGLEHSENWSTATIHSDPTFVPKTRSLSVPPITIPALTSATGDLSRTDTLLCPVRALQIYLTRTASIREGRKRLFLSHQTGFKKDIAMATISSWLCSTVKECYKEAPQLVADDFKVTGHQVRAMSTSWAFAKRASLADIMNAASWRSHTTFTRFYLRDVTNISDNMLKLGPVVAAQLIL